MRTIQITRILIGCALASLTAWAGTITGTVAETLNAGGYTYIKVNTADGETWAAAPEIELTIGEQISFNTGMVMKEFQSKTLDRTFATIYFVGSVNRNEQTEQAKPLPSHQQPKSTAVAADDIKVEKAVQGYTIAELYEQKDSLSGKPVAVKAKVVKFNAQIMGKNWIHLQDGSGNEADGTHDLTVTTDHSAEVGDTVIVSGNLTKDRDFGHGYAFAVIIEDGSVSKE